MNQAGATARADIAPLSVLPKGSTFFSSPYGTAVSVGGTPAANPLAAQIGLSPAMSLLGGILPWLLIGGGVLLLFSVVGSRR